MHGGGKRSHLGVEAGGFRPARGNGELITIPAITLDGFVANGGPVPHLVKIDVEGGEFEVLRGSEHLYAQQQPSPTWWLKCAGLVTQTG